MSVFDPRGCLKGQSEFNRKAKIKSLLHCNSHVQSSSRLSVSLISGLIHVSCFSSTSPSRDKAAVEQCHHSGCVCLALHRLLVRHAPHRLGRVRLRAPEDLLHSGLQQGRQVGARKLASWTVNTPFRGSSFLRRPWCAFPSTETTCRT